MFYSWCLSRPHVLCFTAVFFSLALCCTISPSCLCRLPQTFDTWLEMCAVHLDSVGPKIWGLPQNNFGASAFCAFTPKISELPRPFTVKLCRMMGNRCIFKSLVQKFGCPLKKCTNWQTILRITANNFGASGSNLRNMSAWCAARQGRKFGHKLWGLAPLKFPGAQLGTILD